MKINRYEAHITIDIQHAKEAKIIAYATGWKYSQIHGCPIMGDKTYCYLTGYNAGDAFKLRQSIDAVISLCIMGQIPVLRAKIEHIIYDTKTGVDTLKS